METTTRSGLSSTGKHDIKLNIWTTNKVKPNCLFISLLQPIVWVHLHINKCKFTYHKSTIISKSDLWYAHPCIFFCGVPTRGLKVNMICQGEALIVVTTKCKMWAFQSTPPPPPQKKNPFQIWGGGHTWVVQNPCGKIGHLRQKGIVGNISTTYSTCPTTSPTRSESPTNGSCSIVIGGERKSSYASTWRCKSYSILEDGIMYMHDFEWIKYRYKY